MKTRWLMSILLAMGILAVGIAGIGVGVSGADSGKVYVTPAPWEKAAPAKESAGDIPKTLAKLIEQKKQMQPKPAGKKYDLPSPWTEASVAADDATGVIVATKTSARPHKTFSVASPWVMAETKEAAAIKSAPPKNAKVTLRAKTKSQKNVTAASSANSQTYKITYDIQKLPKPQKTFTAASPWAKAAPALGTKRPVATQVMVVPPNPSRVVACELRLARVSDGKVLSQVSALDSYANINRLAEVMVGRLASECPGGKVVVMTLCNRRGTNQGRLIAGEMSNNVTTALKNSQGLEFIRILNLREILTKEQKLESAKDITAPRFKILLSGADYVLIGGVALGKPVPVRLDTAKTPAVSINNFN
ncbi:MAG: hypothetical protein KAR11_00545 [Phycisphaerae bacterium]|nr:hypothetical protein [Phycisphaerae bacterium]